MLTSFPAAVSCVALTATRSAHVKPGLSSQHSSLRAFSISLPISESTIPWQNHPAFVRRFHSIGLRLSQLVDRLLQRLASQAILPQ